MKTWSGFEFIGWRTRIFRPTFGQLIFSTKTLLFWCRQKNQGDIPQATKVYENPKVTKNEISSPANNKNSLLKLETLNFS